MKLLDYEKKHIEYLAANAHECALFLKKDDTWPVKEPGKLALFGNGARSTIKGGTGSGDVASRFFVNFEDGLKDDGFEIVTKDWIDAYEEIKQSRFADYVKRTKKEAKQMNFPSYTYSMGYFDDEPEYQLPLTKPEYEAEMAVYVVTRE